MPGDVAGSRTVSSLNLCALQHRKTIKDPIMSLVIRRPLRIASLVFASILCAVIGSAQIAPAQPPQFPALQQFPPPPRFPVLPPLLSLPRSQHKYDLVLSGAHVLDPKN